MALLEHMSIRLKSNNNSNKYYYYQLKIIWDINIYNTINFFRNSREEEKGSRFLYSSYRSDKFSESRMVGLVNTKLLRGNVVGRVRFFLSLRPLLEEFQFRFLSVRLSLSEHRVSHSIVRSDRPKRTMSVFTRFTVGRAFFSSVMPKHQSKNPRT